MHRRHRDKTKDNARFSWLRSSGPWRVQKGDWYLASFSYTGVCGRCGRSTAWSRLAYGHGRHAIDGVFYALSGTESLSRTLRDGEGDSASPIRDGGEAVDETGGMRHAVARLRHTMSRATWRWAGIGMAFVMGVWFGTKLAGTTFGAVVTGSRLPLHDSRKLDILAGFDFGSWLGRMTISQLTALPAVLAFARRTASNGSLTIKHFWSFGTDKRCCKANSSDNLASLSAWTDQAHTNGCFI